MNRQNTQHNRIEELEKELNEAYDKIARFERIINIMRDLQDIAFPKEDKVKYLT